jgi:DNA-binding PadR family transcriptional regulator
MPGYYRPIPEYIATSLLLTAEEKLFYGLIASLVSEKERGFCWASNEFLSERERVNPRTIQRWIRKLVKHKFVIVELVHNRERKMWTPETWGNRENLRRAYGSDSIDETENFQKKIDHDISCVVAPRHQLCRTSNEVETKAIKHIEARPTKSPPKDKWPKRCKTPALEAARPSGDMKKNEEKAPAPEVKVLKPSMKGATPTPGSDKMVEEVIDILRSPHRLGTQRVILAKGDWEYLFGFSPSIIEKAFARAHKASQKGEKIYNLTAWLYTMCSQIKLE